MTLDLTEAEHLVLLDVLRERLGEMREQVYHADTASFKDDLKQREELIRQMIEKCEVSIAS